MAAGGRLVLHPSFSAYTNKWLRNLALPMVAIVGIVLVYRWMTDPGAGTTLLFTVGGLALLGVLFFGRAEISLDSGVLSYRRFAFRHRFPIELVGGLALRRLNLVWNYNARGPTPQAIVYGRDRRALFSLSAALWTDRDLRSLQKAIGGDSSPNPVTAVELQSEFPGALPGWLIFMEAHPVWTMVINFPLALAITLAIVAIWDAIK
jgi:hypothetical protein